MSGDCAQPDLGVHGECGHSHAHHDGGACADGGGYSMLVTADGSFYNDALHLYHVRVVENVVLFRYCNGNKSDFTSLKVPTILQSLPSQQNIYQN
jgi:hypothetical protein